MSNVLPFAPPQPLPPSGDFDLTRMKFIAEFADRLATLLSMKYPGVENRVADLIVQGRATIAELAAMEPPANVRGEVEERLRRTMSART